MDIEFLSATELTKLIQTKQIGSLELLEHYIKRVEAYNPAVNAVVSSNLIDARIRAHNLDRLLVKRRYIVPPLHGIPITLKDIFNVPGITTTFGKENLKDNLPQTIDPLVQKLLDAGCVVLGKTNVPPGAIGWYTSNTLYGTTSNPWDLTRTVGGSSGGGAAAVAAGLTGLDLGNDRGGSLRNPAHYCGVYSHKMSSSLNEMLTVGPFTRSASDLETVISVLQSNMYPESRKESIKDFRIAVLSTCHVAEVDSTIMSKLNELSKFLANEGAVVTQVEHNPPSNILGLNYSRLQETYFKLVHFFQPQITNATGDGLPEVDHWWKRNILPSEAKELMDARDLMAKKLDKFFKKYDVIITPCAATTAPLHTEVYSIIKVNGTNQKVHYQKFWAGLASLFSLPSTTIPIGQINGLPVGAQIIGPKLSDYTTIKLAQLLEEKYYKFQAPSGFGPLPE